MRPNWYGNCVATYGFRSVRFENITCRAPTLTHPVRRPNSQDTQIDTSMFVFYTSFGGDYPDGNKVTITHWTFQDLDGQAYTPDAGTMGDPGLSGMKAWTRSKGGVVAPYYL